MSHGTINPTSRAILAYVLRRCFALEKQVTLNGKPQLGGDAPDLGEHRIARLGRPRPGSSVRKPEGRSDE